MSKRSYSGDPIDSTYQNITERPELENDNVVYVTEAEEQGEETTENVPMPGAGDDGVQRPVVPGQTTLTEWGGSNE